MSGIQAAQGGNLMKKYLVCFVLALAAVAGALLLSGCSLARQEFFSDSDAYTAGDAAISDRVDAIDIAWLSGEVRVERGEGTEVLLSETSDTGLTEKMRLQWLLDGGTLRVKFASAGAREETENYVDKQLTITLPRDLALREFRVHTSSAGLAGDIGTAEEVHISTASGDTNILCDTPELRTNSASGSVAVENRADAPHTIDIRAVSGCVSLSYGRSSGTVYVKTTSGSISVSAEAAENLTLESTSGKIDCVLRSAGSQNGEFKTTSGDIILCIPRDQGFTLEKTTGSGRLNGGDFGFSEDEATCVYGDGSAAFRVTTTSGNVTLR